MLRGIGHLYPMLAFEMGYRRKCQIAHDFCQNFGGVLVNPLVSKNGPFWQLIAAKNRQDFGEIGHSRGNRKCCSEWAISNSDQSTKLGLVRNVRLPMILPKLWANHGQSVYLQNGAFRQLIAAKNWPGVGGNRALRRRLGVLRKWAIFQPRVEFEMRNRQICQIVLDFPTFWGARPIHLSPKMTPSYS